MRLGIHVTGHREASDLVHGLADRVVGPLDELMPIIGETLASGLQRNIRTEGQSLGAQWPALHPVTHKIRRHYGHGDKGRLVRGGDLLQSIRVQSVEARKVEAGSELDYASVTDSGGTYEGRTIQAFPWLGLGEQAFDDIVSMVLDYVMGEDP